MSDYYNQLAVDSMRPDPEPPEPVSDTSGLTDEDMEKLADYDILRLDARFAARRLILFLQRWQGKIPDAAAEQLRVILDELLMGHLLSTDHKWLAEMIRRLEAA